MPLLSRLSPTVRAYIREEYRRVWTRKEYLTLLFAMVAVEVLRMAATWVALPTQVVPAASALQLLSPLGFTSGIVFALRFSYRMAPGWSWPFWILGEFLGGLVVLAPYYAGRSIASARRVVTTRSTSASNLPPLGRAPINRALMTRVSLKTNRSSSRTNCGSSEKK